jgi:hypothetical protein
MPMLHENSSIRRSRSWTILNVQLVLHKVSENYPLMRDFILRNEKKLAYLIVIIAGVLVALLLFILSFYDHPSADDFNYSVNVRQYGFFGSQYYWYVSWCGRYLSTFLLSLNPLIYGSFTGYKLMSAILILLSIISFYFFTASLFKPNTIPEKLYITFLSFFAFILLMPSVAEGYYWMAGAYSYQGGNILTLLLFVMMIVNLKKPSKKVFVVSAIIVLALAGSNEYSMLFLVLLLLFINVLRVIRHKKISSYYFVLLILAVVGSMVVYFAPGNAYRASFQTNNFQFVFSLKSSFREAFDVISHWWWIGGFIILASYKIASSKMSVFSEDWFKSIYLNPFLVLAFIFMVIAAGFFSCYWSLGLYPPLRTINTIYFYFITGSVYTGLCTAILLKRFKIPDVPFIHYLVLILLFVYVIKFPNNISRAWHDLNDGIASAYDRELNNRYKTLQTVDCKKCAVSKLKNVPKTLFFSDISEKTDNAMLKSYAYFFNKDSIFVESK